MSKRKIASLALVIIWILMGIALLIIALTIGNSNIETRPFIMKILWVYLASIPVYGIILTIIRRKQMVLQISLWSVFALGLWYFLIPRIIR